jgi:hypothetical protein
MNIIELKLDLSRPIPLSFNPNNSNMSSWNYQFCGGSAINRAKLISSVLTAQIVESNPVINIVSSNYQNKDYKKIINMIGGKSMPFHEIRHNIFLYNPKAAPLKTKDRISIFEKIKKEHNLTDKMTEALIEETVKPWSELDTEESIIEKDFANTIPTDNTIYLITKLLTIAAELNTSAQAELKNELHLFYQQNTEKPNFALFLSFLKVSNVKLLTDLENIYNSVIIQMISALDSFELNQNGNYFYMDSYNGFCHEVLATLLLSMHLTSVKERKKYLIMDNLSERNYAMLDALRTSRLRGICTFSSNEKYDTSSDLEMAIQSNIRGHFLLDLDLGSAKKIEEFSKCSHPKLNLNYLMYNLGLKREQEKQRVQARASEPDLMLIAKKVCENIKNGIFFKKDIVKDYEVHMNQGFIKIVTKKSIIGIFTNPNIELINKVKKDEKLDVIYQLTDEPYRNKSFLMLSYNNLMNEIKKEAEENHFEFLSYAGSDNSKKKSTILYIDHNRVGLDNLGV